MPIKLKNNVSSTITSTITASDIGLTVATGAGALFPALAVDDYFYATLVSTNGTIEVVKVTARSGDSMTIQRAQDNTTAQSFTAGSRIEMRVNVGAIAGYVQDRVVLASDFGATGDGVTDDTAAILAAVGYAVSINGATIVFDAKNYVISDTILVQNSNVKLRGAGNDMQHLSGGTGDGPATKFIWNGSVGGVMFSFVSPQGAANHKRVGQELSGCFLEGSGTAGKGVNITSVNELLLSRVHIEGVTQDGVYSRCYNTGELADATDNQRMFFSIVTFNLRSNLSAINANGFNLGGSVVIPGGNTSLNLFQLCQGITRSGVPLLIDNADNCVFIRCSFSCSVTGTNAVEIRGNGASGANHFYNLGATREDSGGARAIRLLGQASGYPNDTIRNSFWMNDNSNGTQVPLADSGCTFTNIQDNGFAKFVNLDTTAIGNTITTANAARANIGASSLCVSSGADAHIRLIKGDTAAQNYAIRISGENLSFARVAGNGFFSFENTQLFADLLSRVSTKTSSGGISNDRIILVDATSNNVTITLALAATFPAGRSPLVNIKRIDSSVNVVNVVPQSFDTLNGGSSETLSVGQGKTYVCNPAANAWYSF